MLNTRTIEIMENIKFFHDRNEIEKIELFYEKHEIKEALNRALIQLKEVQTKIEKNPELLKELEKIERKMNKKTRTITFRLDENLSNKLTKVSLRDNISVGELCRNLLNGGLENENKNNKHKKSDR